MKLTKFKITSFKSCANTQLQLGENLTALIGPNGAGKTNILKSIMLLRKILRWRRWHSKISKRAEKSTLVVDFKNGEIYTGLKFIIYYDFNKNNSEEVLGVKVQLRHDAAQKKWSDIPIDMLWQDKRNFIMPRTHRIKLSDIERENWFARNRTFGEMLNLPKSVSKNLLDISSFINNIHYYAATKYADPSNCPSYIELEDTDLTWRTPSSNTHAKFILDLYRAYKQRDKHERYQKFINVCGANGMNLITKFSFQEVKIPSTEFEVTSGGKTIKKRKEKIWVIPKVTQGRTKLSPNQLSEGTFKTMALTFYLLSEVPSMMLIEEPEVCVHHGLLNSIMEIIKAQSKHRQIIISTHSNYVVDRLEPANICVIQNDGKSGTKAKHLKASISAVGMKALEKYLNSTGNLGDYWRESGFDG